MSSPKIKWDAPGHWGALALTLLGVGTEVACDWLTDAVCSLEVLKEKHPNTLPPDMRISELAKIYRDSLCGSKGLNPGQLATIFPSAGLPDIDRFDIPLVHAVVRHCFPTPDGQVDASWSGWTKEPVASNQGGIFEIIRVRALFAELRSTSPDEVAEEDFRRLWQRMRGALLRLCPETKKSSLERTLYDKRSSCPGEEHVNHMRALIGGEQQEKKEEGSRRASRAGKVADLAHVLSRADSILQGGKLPETLAGRRTSVGRKAFSGRQAALLTKFRAAGHKVMEDVRQQAARAKNKLGPGQTDPEECPAYILRPMNKVAEFLKGRYKTLFSQYRPFAWYERLHLPIHQLFLELVPVEDSAGRREACGVADLFIADDKVGRRVLVEGDYSSGKTTCCRRLAVEWALGQLPHFRLVFLVHLKHLQGNLLDVIFKDLKKISGTSVNRDEFTTYLRCHQHELIFLLDGLDEMEADIQDQSDVNELLANESDEGICAVIGQSSILLTARPVAAMVSGMDARYRLPGFSRETASQFINRQLSLRQDKDAIEGTVRILLREHGSSTALVHPLPLALLCDLADADWPPKDASLTQVMEALMERLVQEFCIRQARFCRSHGFEGPGVTEHLELLGELAWKGLRDGRLAIPVRLLQQQVGVKKCELLLRLGILTVHESETALGATKQAEFVAKPFAEFIAAMWLTAKAKRDNEDLRPLLKEIHVADFFYQVASSKRLHNSNVYQFAFGLLSDESEAAVRLLRTLCEDSQAAAREHDVFPWWCACYTCIDEAGDAGTSLAAALLPFLERKLLSLDFDRGRQSGTRGLVKLMHAQQGSGRGHGIRFESGEALKELLGVLGDDRYRYDLVELHVDSWECWQEDDDLTSLCARLLAQFRCRVLRLSIPPMFCVQALHENVLPLMGSAGVTTLALDFHLDHFPTPPPSTAGEDGPPKLPMDDVVRAVARAVAQCRELRYLRVQFAACPDVQFECGSRALQTLNEAIEARGPRLTVDLSWPFVE